MTRVVCISDTHGLHDQMEPLPDGDLLIHAGDFSNYGTLEDVIRFNAWLGTIKDRYPLGIVICAGNHDRALQEHYALSLTVLTNCTYLQDSGVTLPNGLKVYGSPWQPSFMDWSFNLPRGRQLAAKWAAIPEDTDILITHGPPYMVMDETPSGEHVGCEALARRLIYMKKRPRLHVFGHIHAGHGIERSPDGKHTSVNAATCTEQYAPINPPIVVTL